MNQSAEIVLFVDEQNRLTRALFRPDDDCTHNLVPLFREVTQIIRERTDPPASTCGEAQR